MFPLSLIHINMLIKGLMADVQLGRNLLGTPLHAQQGIGFIFNPRRYHACVEAVLVALNRQLTCFLWTIPVRADIVMQLAANPRHVKSDQAGVWRDDMLNFHKADILVSFNLACMFVIHRANSTCRS